MIPLLRSKTLCCSSRAKVIYSTQFKFPLSIVQTRNYSNGNNGRSNPENENHFADAEPQAEPKNEESKETPQEAGQETPGEEIYRDQVEIDMALDAQIEILRKQINDVKYNWRLTLADIDNLTKKAHKDTAIAREAGAEKIIKKLFPIMDNIDYCLRCKPDFNSPEHAENLEARGAFDGLESAKKQFCNALVSYDVHEIAPMIGDMFDPLVHEAVFEIEQPEEGNVQPGQIGTILKAGWIKKGILLRPASVAVVKVPEIPIPFNFQREEGDTSVMLEEDETEDNDDILDEKNEQQQKQNKE